MESNLIETKTETPVFNPNKLCPMCNKVNKFKVVQHKTKGECTSGLKCISCTSKKNNTRLKALNYYKNYYQQNAEKLKAMDKVRYQKKKELNLVKFNFDDGAVLITEE